LQQSPNTWESLNSGLIANNGVQSSTYDYIPNTNNIKSGDQITFGNNNLGVSNSQIQQYLSSGMAQLKYDNSGNPTGITFNSSPSQATAGQYNSGDMMQNLLNMQYQSLNSNSAQYPTYQQGLDQTAAQRVALEQQRLAAEQQLRQEGQQLIQGARDVGGREAGTLSRILGRAGGFTTTAGGQAVVAQDAALEQNVQKLTQAQNTAISQLNAAYATKNADLIAKAQETLYTAQQDVQKNQNNRISNLLNLMKMQEDTRQFDIGTDVKGQQLLLDAQKLGMDAKTSDIKDFEYAQQNGYEGQFTDFLNSQQADATIKQYEYAVNQGYGGSIVDFLSLKATQAGNDLDKLLSPTEAQLLGLPYGTTREEAAAQGVQALSPKARETIKAVGDAQVIFNQLKGAVDKLNLSNTPWLNFGQGLKLTIGAGSKSDLNASDYQALANSMLSKISRATGEVGVLNEGDINRAKSAIPTFYDTKESAQRKLIQLNDLFTEFQKRAMSAYTTTSSNAGNITSGTTTPSGNGSWQDLNW
jgi:plastocyanin